MKNAGALALLVSVAAAGGACGGAAAEEAAGGRATAVVDGTSYAVSDVTLTFEAGEHGYFRIEGRDATHPEEDCLPGLGGGLALYGEIPSGVTTVADLSGRELPIEFTGDGDDFNLCFVGSEGLLGVNSGTVKFTGMRGSSVAFIFAGTFDRFDGEGGEEGRVRASGDGTATFD